MKKWTIYHRHGLHCIYDLTDEEFMAAKNFYKLFEYDRGMWVNARGDIFVWRKDSDGKENKERSKDA